MALKKENKDMKEMERCTLRGKHSTLREKQENKDLCIHSTSGKHLPYQELISNGKITFLTVGMSVNSVLLQAAFATEKFHYITV